jgi:hypothetical protein
MLDIGQLVPSLEEYKQEVSSIRKQLFFFLAALGFELRASCKPFHQPKKPAFCLEDFLDPGSGKGVQAHDRLTLSWRDKNCRAGWQPLTSLSRLFFVLKHESYHLN